MNKPIDIRMIKARASLMQSQPFWGCLAMYLELVEDEAVETMAVDGEHLFYAPSFLDKLTQKEIEGVIAHEVSHCVYKHHLRRGVRDPDEWNDAADYAINPGLEQAGFILPDGCLNDVEYAGMGAEEIFARRKAEQTQQSQQGQPQAGAGTGPGGKPGVGQPQAGGPANAPGQPAQGPQQAQGAAGGPGPGTTPAQGPVPGLPGPGSAAAKPLGQGGRVLDAPVPPSAGEGEGAVEAGRAAQSAEWDRRVLQAVAVAKKAGKAPGDADELTEAITAVKVDWRELLRRFIDAKTRTVHSWNRPNRRFISSGFILPGTQSDGIQKLGIYIDSSGSIDKNLAADFFGQVESAIELGAIESVVMIQADTVVQWNGEYRAGDVINPIIKGRGGTSFEEGFQWFADNEPDVAAIIMFTDLECGSDWGEDPGMPVLWAAYGFESAIKKRSALAPFGEVIHVEG